MLSLPLMSEKRTEISELGEFKLIDRILEKFETQQDSTIIGPGDDAAILLPKETAQVVTTDILIEGIHFDLAYCPLKHLGYKSVVVNLSDVYAMNAEPKQILISLGISNRFSVEAIDELYEGVHLACKEYSVDLVGGDTTASPKGLVINVVAIGEQRLEKIVKRSGAQEGDALCVSGNLGAAYIGLQLLEREKRIFLENPSIKTDLSGHEYLVGRQLKPSARKDIYEFFKTKNIVPTSMIDISDGLSSEIIHLCQKSNLGCQIEESEVPIAEETAQQAIAFNIDPITCALSGGEDYELLFTVKISDLPAIGENMNIAIIGCMLDEGLGIKLHTKGDNYHDIISLGWDGLKDEE